jgi:hypothetical protein
VCFIEMAQGGPAAISKENEGLIDGHSDRAPPPVPEDD